MTNEGQLAPQGLWEKIQRHKVVEWTLAYVAGGFALVHAVGEKPQVAVTQPITGNPANAAAAFAPPPHSVAVLPFVNMSGDTQQEYFSDGLTEEILNSLARINELQVSARTSSFSFKGKDADIGTIAHKLNVASVLEGSVRRAGHTIRVTAQLNNAVTGYHLWSQTYDRDLGDVLELQTDIANAVASALKLTLLGDVAAKIEVGTEAETMLAKLQASAGDRLAEGYADIYAQWGDTARAVPPAR